MQLAILFIDSQRWQMQDGGLDACMWMSLLQTEVCRLEKHGIREIF